MSMTRRTRLFMMRFFGPVKSGLPRLHDKDFVRLFSPWSWVPFLFSVPYFFPGFYKETGDLLIDWR